MKTIRISWLITIVVGLLFTLPPVGHASVPGGPGGGGGGGGGSTPTYTPLDSWSFHDSTNWTSDLGYAPVSFTNLTHSYLGDGASLVVNTSAPAWLNYNVVENDGTTNLTVDNGTVMFWFAPANWSSTNMGGTGPGQYGRLLEAGGYTPDSSYGLWSIYVDAGGNNLYFSTQTNDFSSNLNTYISVPISWTTNYFHAVVLTYSSTNTSLYLDGVLASNGPALTVYPGQEALTNGFFVGSSSNGVNQASGMFNDLVTYNTVMDSNTIQQTFSQQYIYYMMDPWNSAMDTLSSGSYIPSTGPSDDVISGAGILQWDGAVSRVYGTNAYNVWMTNLTSTLLTNGSVNYTFTIQGGVSTTNNYFDLFATAYLANPVTNALWVWLGQGTNGGSYTLNISSQNAFFVLGTPQDTDGDGLTDAYELLVSHTNPDNPDTDGSGLSDGWQVLLGLNPLVNQVAQPTTRNNYSYTLDDWLDSITGIKDGSISLDNEGNVTSVSQ